MSSRKELSGKKIGSSHAECVLKASLTDIIKGDVDKGKTRILDFLQAETKKGSVNCWGSEYDRCLVMFRNVWKVYLSMQCTSTSCPNPIPKSRYPMGFSLYLLDSVDANFSDQIAGQFPTLGHRHGYCGEKFVPLLVDRLQLFNQFTLTQGCAVIGMSAEEFQKLQIVVSLRSPRGL